MDYASHSHPYEQLTPDRILNAVDAVGWRTDGRILPLNSYENRVYQIGIEDEAPLVAKFYRPGRWSDNAILEEHRFTLALSEREIPAVPPLRTPEGQTLFEHEGFRFALYPRRGGRWPNLETREHLAWVGRFIGRIHAVGSIERFAHRPTLNVESFGYQSYQFVLEKGFVPQEWQRDYRDAAEAVLPSIDEEFQRLGDAANQRLHGDCHPGNILWTEEGGPHFVDFDDARNGPVVQDLWMLLAGEREEMALQLTHLIDGYEEFHGFDFRQLRLIEPLRTLRLLHYSAWLAKRWKDPAFPKNFPWFNERHYWQEQTNLLREQAIKIDQPPLQCVDLD